MRRLLPLLACLALGGCGVIAGTVVDLAEDAVTYPFKEWVFWGAFRYDNPWDEPWTATPRAHDDGKVLVGVCISGGGSRSAYFAACVLDALGKHRIPGTDRTYLEELDCLSSVSGGSLAATYYCLNRRREGWPADHDEFFARMREDMRMDFEMRAITRAGLGWGFPLMFTHYDRGDLMAAVWDSNFLDGLTYADLPADGPALLVNAACYDTGQRFVFTTLHQDELNDAKLFQELARGRLLTRGYGSAHVPFSAMTFQTIGSSIRACPLSTGVVASAAVPNLLGPVTLRKRTQPERDVHLGDGGIYDNHGLETLVGWMSRKLEQDPSRPAVLLVVDGSGFFETDPEHTADLSNLAAFVDRSVTIAWLRAASYAEPAFRAQAAAAGARVAFGGISLYDDASFRPEEDGDLETFGEKMKDLGRAATVGLVQDLNTRLRAVGTRFSIADEHAEAIEAATPDIVARSLQRLQRTTAAWFTPPAVPAAPGIGGPAAAAAAAAAPAATGAPVAEPPATPERPARPTDR